MSATSVTTLRSVGGIDDEGHQDYTVDYHVKTNSVNDGPYVAINATGVARWGDAYSYGSESNAYAFCRRLRADYAKYPDDRLNWIVQAYYTTKPYGGYSGSRGGELTSTGLFQSPLDEPWKISGSYVRLTRVTDRDRNGDAITNSAHEPKVAEVPYGHDTLRLEGPSATLSLSTRAQAMFAVNSATIWGLTARQLMMTSWTYDIRYYGTQAYVHNSLEFEINYAGWNEVFVDAGFREYVGKDIVTNKPIYRQILSSNGVPVTSPVLLGGDGLIISDDDVTAGSYYTITKQVIGEFDFTTLGFPSVLPGPFV